MGHARFPFDRRPTCDVLASSVLELASHSEFEEHVRHKAMSKVKSTIETWTDHVGVSPERHDSPRSGASTALQAMQQATSHSVTVHRAR